MKRLFPKHLGFTLLIGIAVALSGCGGKSTSSTGSSGSTTNTPPPDTTSQLTVTLAGNGSGSVTSSPAGISCGSTCSASFSNATSVQLTATANQGSTFAGWSGACSGAAACTVNIAGSNLTVTATFNQQSAGLGAINHIVFMAQENRSLDHYFGQLPAYWAANGFPAQPFDGEPANASNPGCDPLFPPPNHCTIDPASPTINAYHLNTMCIQNLTPSWNESHVDFNNGAPGSQNPKMNGFVHMAGSFARTQTPMYFDTDGIRTMGYYDGNDLNYYYFMASNFGTSDRWFSPVMTRTQLNRMYLIAATSHGHVRPLNNSNSPQLSDLTIFQLLQEHGISWKIYVHPDATGCTTTVCLMAMSYINQFKFEQTIVAQFPQNIAPISQYFTDLANGTLPQVALIEPASNVGLDEHPSESPTGTGGVDVQAGARYVSTLINALMASSSWQSSAFILTWDEMGGLYDHVPPHPAVNPDGIPPSDLIMGDVCSTGTPTGTCDFQSTGFRVPLIVVSPFAKKNFVSHTVADYTAILKLIETRFGLPNLTARDAAQMDMTEFFDFKNPAWMTPPTPPAQNTGGACYLDHLP
jgi:phospholipase C